MFVEALLILWSGCGLLWWVISWRLVVTAPKAITNMPGLGGKKISLTIFKPLPPLEKRGLVIEARGLESFISQMDQDSELLLGVHEPDWPLVAPFVQEMQSSYPDSRVTVVRRSESDLFSNPKIAWQKILVPLAKGELWLWSDADIVVPPGFLQRAVTEYESCGAQMLTFPYAIRSLPHPPALLDALFVNAEFYPGVLLLRRFGFVHFGLGAAMLFSRESFLRLVNWEKLGASLADDYVLGQMLHPVQISDLTLETVADATEWSSAFEHYFRWKKTVCACQPLGFAAQIIVMPLFGWIGLVLWNPGSLQAWLGFFGMVQADVFFAGLICRAAGCRLNFSAWLIMQAWSLWRIIFWIWCWLPYPVKWRDKLWHYAQEHA